MSLLLHTRVLLSLTCALDHSLYSQILIEGPEALTGVKRQVINVKWLAVTDVTVTVPRNARAKTMTKAWTTEETQKKWNATAWAKKLAAKKTKAGLTDFQRFSARVAKQKVNKAVKAKLAA